MKYIYHFKSEPFVGNHLVPLNYMDKSGEVYKKHIKKYQGRENLMDSTIPALKCKWNDVVQFSSISHQRIFDELKNHNTEMNFERKYYYFKIDIQSIIEKHEVVIYKPEPNKRSGDYDFKTNEFEVVTYENYEELVTVPEKTINYWKDIKKNGGQFLWFNFIPHIFVKGFIDVSDFEICLLET